MMATRVWGSRDRRKPTSKSQEDGSVGQGTCYQADNLNLILKTHTVEESTLENCPLACTLGLLCVQAPSPRK